MKRGRKPLLERLDVIKDKSTFLEITDVYDANKVDMKIYKLLRFSEKRNRYIFMKRAKWL